MKLDLKTILIAGLTVVLIIFIMKDCSRPSEEREAEKEKQFKTSIAILEADKKDAQARQDSLAKVLILHTLKDSIERSAFKIENTRIKKQLATRRPQVQVLIDSTPPLRAFIQTQDSIILTQDVRIDSLEASLRFQHKLHEDLIIAEFQEDRAEQQMFIEQERRIEELQKQGRKKERKSRLAKVLIPVVAVGAFLLGATL